MGEEENEQTFHLEGLSQSRIVHNNKHLLDWLNLNLNGLDYPAISPISS